jgi:hypothetical protein
MAELLIIRGSGAVQIADGRGSLAPHKIGKHTYEHFSVNRLDVAPFDEPIADDSEIPRP